MASDPNQIAPAPTADAPTQDQPVPDAGEIEWAGAVVRRPPAPDGGGSPGSSEGEAS